MTSNTTEDPFDSLHSLEESFYQSGYDAGAADGSRAGRIEGRIFGLEKGFEKFVELGRLGGRAEVWKMRISSEAQSESIEVDVTGVKANSGDVFKDTQEEPSMPPKQEKDYLPGLAQNSRLEKHITTLCDLVEPATFDTRNNEDAVADFDDRFKRAKAKAKVIEKIIGEGVKSQDSESAGTGGTGTRRQVRISREQAQERNMEDFGMGR